MVEYGVNVDNKFGFLSDDEFEDPQEILRKAEQKDNKSATEKKADKKKAAQLKKDQAAAALVAKQAEAKALASAGKENRPAGGERGRGGRGRGRGGAPRTPRDPAAPGDVADRFGEGRGGRGGGRGGPRPPFRGRGGNVSGGEEHHAAKEGFEAPAEFPAFDGERRGRGRGGMGPRGRGGPRGGRQFDRQSGSDRTGVRGQDKKDGHGKGNWGTEQDELAGETEEVKVVAEEVAPAPPREKTQEELEFEAIEAEIAKQKTLAEYRATLQKDSAGFNTRKAGEGDSAAFGKLVPMPKKAEEKSEEEIVVIRREPKNKQLNIDFKFTDSNRGESERRGGGRGRGGARGGRGNVGGGQRSARGQPQQFNAEADFPALQ